MSQPKVDELEVNVISIALTGPDDVLGLDVPMGDAFRVNVCNCFE